MLPVVALALNGCAAAALPALAGGAMLRSGGSGDDQAITNPIEASKPSAELAATPAQDPEPGIFPAVKDEFASFASFARNQASLAKIDSATLSAVLLNPGMLDGKRAQCRDLPPAVVIDLDRDDESFGPTDAYKSPPSLAAELSALRESGIVIGWISAANIDHLGTLRYALSQSGLDPEGNDRLLLMEHPDERKQTRREEFAKTHCIVAIAGDTLADFDELFLFLNSPDAAKPLTTLVGEGWFITPLALTKQ
jgi:hypothetical protein